MSQKVLVKVKKIHQDAILPRYAHPGDAGMDLFSCVDLTIKAGERALVPTGISMEFPQGHVALIWDKSGLAANKGIKTMAGVIEYTYRGEYKIVLLNTSNDDFFIKKGDKIAQVLIQPISTAEVVEVSDLSETSRGAGAFGSTGK